MKYLSANINFVITLLLVNFLCINSLSAQNIIDELDESLKHKQEYEAQKLQRIEQIQAEINPDDQYSVYQKNIALYEEYKVFKYDSAHTYALRSLELAQNIGNIDYIVEAQCAVTFCLMSAGLYKEGMEELGKIDANGASEEYRKKYFSMARRFYYDMADYNHSAPYQQGYIWQGGLFSDSLIQYYEPQSAEWLYANALRLMKEYKNDESIYHFKQLMKQPDLEVHIKAIATSCLGWISLVQGEREAAKSYLAQAAICDNETATKETTALCILASMLYEEGDIERATRFVQLALDDANFYGARQRKILVGDILPIIEQDRFNIVKAERNALKIAFIVAIFTIISLLISTYIIRRQIKKLEQARQTIEQRNRELQDANTQLCEVNAIKDEYIGRSFYLNAKYINKVEKLYKAIDHKIVAKQYADLRYSLKESELMTERQNMFADFDETFLKLFPNFVEGYNMLFDAKDRKLPDSPNSLTNEMRIYALIRLGITDSDRIANFLSYSVHTINTYKTRIKNKSIVDNDEFELRIMMI